MNKHVTFILFVVTLLVVGFFVVRGVRKHQTDTLAHQVAVKSSVKSQVPAKPLVSPEERQKELLKARLAKQNAKMPKENLGLKVAKPRWLKAVELSLRENRKAMVAVARRVADVEQQLRADDKEIGALYKAMKLDFAKYRSVLEGTEAYKKAKLEERRISAQADKNSAELAKIKSDSAGDSRVAELQSKFAKACDSLVAASTKLEQVERDLRSSDPHVASAYAEMVQSRGKYRDTIKRNKKYIKVQSELDKLAERDRDLIKRRDELKKEIGNE